MMFDCVSLTACPNHGSKILAKENNLTFNLNIKTVDACMKVIEYISNNGAFRLEFF